MVIYHTNDVHGNYDFLRKVHVFLKENRTEEDFYFDSGDYCDLKNIIVQADKGDLAMQLIMTCGLDMMAVGNNEIDLTNEALTKLVNKYPLISANLTDNDDRCPDGLAGSRILEKNGKRFLIIGLSPYYAYGMVAGKYNIFYEMGNLHTVNPFDLVGKELAKNKGQYDYCILLSHSGIAVDDIIKEKYPEIDLYLGGHCHSVINDGNYNQCGRGDYLGKITLDITDDGIKIVKNELVDVKACVADEAEDEEFDTILGDVSAKADAIMMKEIPAAGELLFDAFKECETVNFICDCLYKHFGGDFTFMHNGIAEYGLKKPVSRGSLIKTFPSKLNPTFYKIKGAKVLEALKLSLDDDYIRQDGQGAGFRGSVLGTLCFSHNVQIETSPLKMYLNGEELDPEKEYQIVTDDYLQRGSGYKCLGVPDEEASYDPWFIRDLVEHYIMDEEMYKQAKIRRTREKK